MGSSDYFAPGEWNFTCALCGAKRKSNKAMKTWDGHYVCAAHKEVRNPQDFLRGNREDQGLPWTRPSTPPIFVHSCTLQGKNAIPGFAIPGCAVPAYINLAFLPSVTP